MILLERVRELREKGLTFKEIVQTCEREGLLKESKTSMQVLRNRFYKKYPSYKRAPPHTVASVKSENREEVAAVFRKGLKDIGYSEREIKTEIKKLLK